MKKCSGYIQVHGYKSPSLKKLNYAGVPLENYPMTLLKKSGVGNMDQQKRREICGLVSPPQADMIHPGLSVSRD